MKKTIYVTIFALLCAAIQVSGADLSKVFITGKTNKPALSYKAGEEMIYTFKAEMGDISPDGYFLHYERKGDDGITFKGKVPASEILTVKTSLKSRGFVSVTVFLVDKQGKIVSRGDKVRRPYRRIGYYAGSAVEPEKLTDCGEPADFDKFWENQKKRLAEVPFIGKVEEKLISDTKKGRIYQISIPCAGPRPATGYLTVPRNAKPKSLPAQISFFGYGARPAAPPKKISRNEIIFYLNAHGQYLDDEAKNNEYLQSIRSNGHNYAFDPEQNRNPETAFFNGMTMRIMRALEYLKTRPEYDGKNLYAAGGSQGGLQTMWAAALDQDVVWARPGITWCCDMAGTDKKGRLHGTWRVKYVPGLDYYDPVFMAKRIKKARVDIVRAGLGDYTCPPSGLAISYNNLATPDKSIKWVQGSDHGYVPEDSEVTVWATEKNKKNN